MTDDDDASSWATSWAALRGFLADVLFVDWDDGDGGFPWAGFAMRTSDLGELVEKFRAAVALGELDNVGAEELEADPEATAVRVVVCGVVNELFAGDVDDARMEDAFDELDEGLRQVAEEDPVRREIMGRIGCSSREVFRRFLGSPDER
jgi:hypothetical protein